MDLIADRGRRVTVDELNTTRLLAHARKQAVQRKFDDVLIVDVDAHHYENEHMSEILPFMENDVLKQITMGGRVDLPAPTPAVAGRLHPGHGRPRHALSDARLGEDRAGPASRHPARRALDGRHERRLLLPVPDRHAQHRHASAEGNGSRAVLGLQPLAHREGAAGVQQPLLLDAVHPVQRSRRVAAPCRDLRRPQGRRRLHGHDRAQPAGQRQRLHEGLSRDGRARPGAVVPLRPELVGAGVPRLQPLPVGACARLLVLQHPPLHQLGHQRHGRALPQAAGGVDRSPASPGCRS